MGVSSCLGDRVVAGVPMINYTLHFSGQQIDLLFWVENGCPGMDTKDGQENLNRMSFIRNVSKLIHLGYTINQHPKSPAYLLTEKGEILAWFLHMELQR